MADLRSQLEALGTGGVSNQAALRGIFNVNNELGRLARSEAPLSKALIELQAHVNLVTVEVKRGRPTEAREALRLAAEKFSSIKENFDARRSQKEFISNGGLETH